MQQRADQNEARQDEGDQLRFAFLKDYQRRTEKALNDMSANLPPLETRGGAISHTPHAYKDSVVVEKARLKRAIILDKDGTIQSKEPTNSEIAARAAIRRKGEKAILGFSTAQTPELCMSFDTYERSAELGYQRLPAQYLMPNNLRVTELEMVPGLRYLLDADFINAFGTGVFSMQKGGGYIGDTSYFRAMGGQAWRKRTMGDLYKHVFGKVNFIGMLADIEREGMYEAEQVDVEALPFRLQFDFTADEIEEWEKFNMTIQQTRILGLGFRHVEIVDESNLKKGRYTTYLVPRLGLKERGLSRLFKEIEHFSGVTTAEFEKIAIAGDQLTDYQSAMYGLPSAKEDAVAFILAAGSPLSEPLYEGRSKHAGVKLGFNRAHPWLKPRVEKTDVEGVLKFRAHKLMPWRTIVLADFAPWSKGLGCAESVLACLEYLGF